MKPTLFIHQKEHTKYYYFKLKCNVHTLKVVFSWRKEKSFRIGETFGRPPAMPISPGAENSQTHLKHTIFQIQI